MTRKTKTDLPKILIVDDKPANIQSLERILEKLEAIFIPAISGKEALSLAIRHDFALILMDVQMPIMDGFETAELLMANEKTRHIPIIFITALSKEEKDVWKGYETGAVDYIFKPVEPAILKSKIRIFLEIYEKKEIENKYSKLKRSHDELKSVFKAQDEQEQKTLDQLSRKSKTSVSEKMHGGGPLNEVDPEFFNSVVADFKVLIEKAIEAQVFKVDHDPSAKLTDTAEELGAYRAGPRDILKIYLTATEYLSNESETDEKKHTINNEAKLLMIELMGDLLSFYRAGYY